jgi:hypothetical protein
LTFPDEILSSLEINDEIINIKIKGIRSDNIFHFKGNSQFFRRNYYKQLNHINQSKREEGFNLKILT